MPEQYYDVVVIGSGPNGLVAAIELARTGHSVIVYEAQPTPGGGLRSQELTLPGFVHDVCSAVYPMATATRYLPSLPLADHGLKWIQPPLPLAHPFDDGTAAVLDRSGEATAERLGDDIVAYRQLIAPVVKDWTAIEQNALAPIRWPRHKAAMVRFAWRALRSTTGLAQAMFQTPQARALWAGLGAHSVMPLDAPASSAVALILASAGHRAGWPIAQGGSQSLADALVSFLKAHGGEVVTGHRIASLDELPPHKIVVCDIAPRALIALCGSRMPAGYRRALERYRPGAGVFKMDWALSAPIPWTAPECVAAGTVHLGGSLEEIAASEAIACTPGSRRTSPHPFVILSQPSSFDSTRAPAGHHTAWAYCHVPNGSTEDMTARIETQIERFAPGFRDVILARSARGPAQLEEHNANLIGGDITGGCNNLGQILRRPTWSAYRTPMKGIYLCSASTPPGGGVHGLCGFYAAQRVLEDL